MKLAKLLLLITVMAPLQALASASPPPPATDYNNPNMPVLTPAEAWGIDSKIDDGKPGTGDVVFMGRDYCKAVPSNCVVRDCTTGVNTGMAWPTNAEYKQTNEDAACALIFRDGY